MSDVYQLCHLFWARHKMSLKSSWHLKSICTKIKDLQFVKKKKKEPVLWCIWRWGNWSSWKDLLNCPWIFCAQQTVFGDKTVLYITDLLTFTTLWTNTNMFLKEYKSQGFPRLHVRLTPHQVGLQVSWYHYSFKKGQSALLKCQVWAISSEQIGRFI